MKSNQIILRGFTAMALWRRASLIESEEVSAREERWLRGDMLHDVLSPWCACNLLQRRRESVPAKYAPRISARAAHELASRWGLDLPLRLHAACVAQNRSTPDALTEGGAIPQHQLVFLEPGVWTVSPEMCLADMARSVGLPELLMQSFELCGHYVCVEGALKSCSPRIAPDDIAELALQLRGASGAKMFRLVARYTLAGSRSPRESALAIILVLPHAFGGYALPHPLLNHEITLSEASAKIWGNRTCEVDGCWPDAKLAYEYQSSLHDANASRDAIKRMALERDGWRVVAIGNGQITHEAQMDEVARLIAGCLKLRLRPRGSGYRAAQHKLFNVLLG